MARQGERHEATTNYRTIVLHSQSGWNRGHGSSYSRDTLSMAQAQVKVSVFLA